MLRTNCHTHTTYCDGTATPAELVQEAMQKGFSCLGFSGHSFLSNGEDWYMSPSGTESYKKEIRALAEKCKGSMDVLCGVEQDFLSPASTEGYDFVIGSVHFVEKDGVLLTVDRSTEDTVMAINEHYSGSFDAFAEDYYALVSRVHAVTGCDIIGHFDLISKFNEILELQESPRYLRAAFEALEALVGCGCPFEINTGAMSRGYRTSPYPSIPILKRLRELGGSVIITSDCHSAGNLDYAFDRALAHAREAGFTEIKHLTSAGFIEEKI